MSKTEKTLRLEEALHRRQLEKREYGCEEITIGFHSQGHGDEIVDYMTLDSKDVVRCFEIKVTVADLKTDNAKSFYGDYNYLVVSQSLDMHSPVYENYIPPYAGILCGEDLRVIRQAKKKMVTDETRNMLKSSILRSVYWKYENYRNARQLSETRDLERTIEDLKEEIRNLQDQTEEIRWNYQDYECYYMKNHQLDHFSIALQATEERKQFADRKKGLAVWQPSADNYECPYCHAEADRKTPFCPFCGADLRKLDD